MTLIMSISARRTLHLKKILWIVNCAITKLVKNHKKCRHGQYFEEDFGMVWTTRYQVQTLFNLPTNYNESETSYDKFVVLVF